MEIMLRIQQCLLLQRLINRIFAEALQWSLVGFSLNNGIITVSLARDIQDVNTISGYGISNKGVNERI
jgi:hypothetical protein